VRIGSFSFVIMFGPARPALPGMLRNVKPTLTQGSVPYADTSRR
jgi:hypothetical protein